MQFHLEVTGEMAREWGEIPAYRESLARTLGERDGAAFIADVGRRAGRAAPARAAPVRELARRRGRARLEPETPRNVPFCSIAAL